MLLKLIKYYWRPFLAIVLIFVIVGISFVYATQTSEAMRIQAVQELDQQWRTDYDLLISPAREQTDYHLEPQQELVRRSDMGNHIGGISLDQYEQIKSIDGVEVAAPLSFLGYLVSKSSYSFWKPDPGLYIVETETEVFDGLRYRKIPFPIRLVSNIINIVEKRDFDDKNDMALTPFFLFDLAWARNEKISIPIRDIEEYFWSVIAVDPEQERKLVGLDAALVEGEFLPNEQSLHRISDFPMLPILLQSKEFDVKRTVRVEKIENDELSIYLTDPLTYKEELLEFTKQNNVRELPKEKVLDVQYNPYSSDLLYFFGDLDIVDGKLEKGRVPIAGFHPNAFMYELSPLLLEEEGEVDGHPLYKASPLATQGEQIHYRTLEISRSDKSFGYDVYGIFDSTLLHNPYSTSSEQKSPDFYNPDQVYITHDTEGNPLAERVEYHTSPSKEAYSTGGVDAITTLPAAQYLLGESPISIIRVVVEGAGERSAESMAKVERIAERIRQETGLTVDVMLGAADRKVQVLLDDFEEAPGYGYLLEGWSQAGASFVIEDRVSNTNLLLSGYIFLMGLTGVFLVFRNYAEVRRKDLIIQYTFGWKKSSIYKQLFSEAGLTVSVVALVLLLVKMILGSSWTWQQFGLGLSVLLVVTVLSICFFYILPVTKGLEKQVHLRSSGQLILPFRTQTPSSSLWGYFWHTVIRYALRSLLKFTLLLATVLYVFLFLLTKGSSSSFLSLTFMGESIDLMLEPYQWVLFGFGLLLSIGSYIAIQMNQMQKRTQEIQLFQAWGWPKKKWLQLYFIEELAITIIALVMGIGGGYWLLSNFAEMAVIPISSFLFLSLAMIGGTILILSLVIGTRSKQNRLREFT